MKRVLIADDEIPIVNGLQLLFKRYFQGGYLVVGTAQSGREVIEKSKTLAPDIVLIDVQMPGINGLDAIRELSQQGGTKAFILVTAYERFDIAREALSMGVCDYLLKPVSKERLEIALQAASSYLDRLHILEEKELEFKEHQQKLLPFVKTAFFVYLRQQRGAKDREPRETKRTKALRDELNLYKEVLHISGEAGVMGIASFSPADGLANSLYEYFCSALQYKTIALAGPLEDNRYCAWFLPLKSKMDQGTAAEAEVTAFLELLSSSFSSQLATGELRFACGQPELLENIGCSWDNAVRSFGLSSESIISSRHRFEEDIIENREEPASAFDAQFYDAIMEGQYAMAGQLLEKLILTVEEAEAKPRDLYFRIIAALSFWASKLAGGGVLSDNVYRDFMDFSDIEKLWEERFWQLFASAVRSRFQSLQKHAAEVGTHSPFVVKALQYIENNYQEPITLESAAAAIGISAGHLTRLMSDELKRGFARTLIGYRIQKAKELLKMPNISIREVSQRCGYSDANYFARLFRRLTGLTPREYAARMAKGENSDA
ncbi:MAG TPA: response regulator [Rectinema sp.]|nr:response regulator [Rectinema sp.]